MALTLVLGGSLTMTGVPVLVVVPSPSCPNLLSPQARTWPVVVRASVCPQPARIDVTRVPGGSCTLTGVSLLMVVSWPSCPSVLSPQARSDPPAAAACGRPVPLPAADAAAPPAAAT